MVEFVTNAGERLAVNRKRKTAIFPNGEVRTICRSRDGGYVVHYHGKEIFGSLRIKAGSRRIPERKTIEVTLVNPAFLIAAYSAFEHRTNISYMGQPHNVIGIIRATPWPIATLLPSSVVTEWTEMALTDPLPDAIEGYRLECRIVPGTDLRRCMYRFVSLDEANA